MQTTNRVSSSSTESQWGTTTDKPPSLKLILKVGGSSGTPEHGSESPSQATMLSQDYQQQLGNYSVAQGDTEYDRYMGHKKLKKKKKKKDKRHKHHHKDKKRRREESSQESVGDADENLAEIPKKIPNHQLLPPRPPSSGEVRVGEIGRAHV